MPARVRTCHSLSDPSSRPPRDGSVKHRFQLRRAAYWPSPCHAVITTSPAVTSDPRAIMCEGEDGRQIAWRVY
jgi:hypothetical protein